MVNTSGALPRGSLFGQLDDFGFWNRALTQQEITQLFNQNQCITNITVTDIFQSKVFSGLNFKCEKFVCEKWPQC